MFSPTTSLQAAWVRLTHSSNQSCRYLNVCSHFVQPYFRVTPCRRERYALKFWKNSRTINISNLKTTVKLKVVCGVLWHLCMQLCGFWFWLNLNEWIIYSIYATEYKKTQHTEPLKLILDWMQKRMMCPRTVTSLQGCQIFSNYNASTWCIL